MDAADRFAPEAVDGQRVEGERIAALEAEAILRDGRIAELVREVEGLRAAMEHRAVIEQAKGVLMHSMGCSAEAAFAVLVAASQRENVKLRDLAARIADSQAKDERAAAQD